MSIRKNGVILTGSDDRYRIISSSTATLENKDYATVTVTSSLSLPSPIPGEHISVALIGTGVTAEVIPPSGTVIRLSPSSTTSEGLKMDTEYSFIKLVGGNGEWILSTASSYGSDSFLKEKYTLSDLDWKLQNGASYSQVLKAQSSSGVTVGSSDLTLSLNGSSLTLNGNQENSAGGLVVVPSGGTNGQTLIKSGDSLIWGESGTSEKASKSTYGLVKIGNNLNVDNGVVSANPSSAPFPSSFVTNSTTLAFCNSIRGTSEAVVGMTYLGGVTLTDMPFAGNSEVIVRIMTQSKVMVLEMFSTDRDTNHWYAMYAGGSMHTGTSACPWQGIMSINGNYSDGYAPVKDYQAASKKYVDEKTVAGLPIGNSPTKAELLLSLGVEEGAEPNILESVTINGTTPTISGKNQSFEITSMSPIPSGVITDGTTLQFCESLISSGAAKVGMMFMGTVEITDTPPGGRAEIVAKVMGTGEGDEVLLLEMNSTNYQERSWVSMWYNHEMQFGTTTCPWFGKLLSPVAGYDSGTPCGNVLLKSYRAASEKFVEDNFVKDVKVNGQTAVDSNRIANLYIPDDFRLAECTGMSIIFSEHNSLTWRDPDNIILNGAQFAKWDKTWLVRKEGSSYPTSPTDGTKVAETSVALENKSAYEEQAFTDSTSVQGTTYSYKLFSFTASGAWNDLENNQYPQGTALNVTTIHQLSQNGTLLSHMNIGDCIVINHPEYYPDAGYEGQIIQLMDYTIGTAANGGNLAMFQFVNCLYPKTSTGLGQQQFDAPELQYALTADMVAQAKVYYEYKKLGVEGTDYTVGDSIPSGVWQERQADYTYSLTSDLTFQAGKSYYKDSTSVRNLINGTDFTVGDAVPSFLWYEKNPNGSYGQGTNKYFESNIDYAISSELPMNTWTKRNLWDQTNMFGKNGFGYLLPQDIKSCLMTVNRKLAISNSYGGGYKIEQRKIFLPTIYEVFGTLNNGIQEGIEQWTYYKTQSKVKKFNNAAINWWLASANSGSPPHSYCVFSGGASSPNYASLTCGVAPAFAL